MNSMQDSKVGANTVLHLLALTAMVFVAPIARSAALAVQPQVGEPTTKVAVSGSGMGAFEDVDLRYDGTTLVSTRADATGAFKAVDVEIPAAALPGRRPITALGHSSGTGASVLFLVRTNWPQFHRGPFRHGFTPHENVLDPTNVSQLKPLWGAGARQRTCRQIDAARGRLCGLNECAVTTASRFV